MPKPFAIESLQDWHHLLQSNPEAQRQRNACESPFEHPDVVVRFDRVHRADILDYLRGCLNKNYMPSADGSVSCNSKPTYTSHTDAKFPAFPHVEPLDYSGTWAFDTFNSTTQSKHLFEHLSVGDVRILVNLTTEEMLVRSVAQSGFFVLPTPWMAWDSDEQTLALDVMALNFL